MARERLMLKGRSRGYAVGLVQLFRGVPHPDLMARYLLDLTLADFSEQGHEYLIHLVVQRDHARIICDAEEVEALGEKIHDHALHERLPQRWSVDFLFSRAVYDTYSDAILAVWATVLIEICTLTQHWEYALLGYPSKNPNLLPGFHSDEELHDTAWLEEAKQDWSGDLGTTVLAGACQVLEIFGLAETDQPGKKEKRVYREVSINARKIGPWIH